MSPTPALELLAVHVGHHQPKPVADGSRASLADVSAVSRTGRPRVLPLLLTESIDWVTLGLQPRWVGDDTTDAVAALEPNVFASHGAQEWDRFKAGAARRGELALAVSMVGSLISDDEPVRSVFGPNASVYIPGNGFTSVGGAEVALARPPELAEGLGRADRELASRIRARRRTELPWWSLSMSGAELHSTSGVVVREPEGTLTPLLTTPGGEVVAAVWESPTRDVRVYVLPALESWVPVLDWLVTYAVPEFVPAAARRTRSSLADDPDFHTVAEAEAAAQLTALETDYATRRATLQTEMAQARANANAVRDPLLFGTGSDLVDAVTRVLRDVGLDTLDLDDHFGDTVSADLLVSDASGRRLLVEVKSASGAPGERVVADLKRHLQTWPMLRPDLPVDGGVLLVNHQVRTPPADRSLEPFTRRVFVESLDVTTLTTTQLFDWWRRGDTAAIRRHLFGHLAGGDAPAPAIDGPAVQARKRRLFGRRPDR